MPKYNDILDWIDPSRWDFGYTDPRVLCVIVGVVLLVAGSRLYRLMIVAPGFVIGVLLATHYAPAGSDMMKMGIIVGVGLAGALIMHLMEQTALRLVGVALMVGLAMAVSPEVFGKEEPWWLNYAAGALGAVGFPILYERALPLITSLLGSLAVAWALGRETDIWMIVILTGVGAAFQTFVAGRSK
jgi:hypothetical protein